MPKKRGRKVFYPASFFIIFVNCHTHLQLFEITSTMRHIITTVFAALLPLALSAVPHWKNIDATSINAVTQRTEIVFFPDRESALGKGFTQSPAYISLNGTWDFNYYDSEKSLPDGIESGNAPLWNSIKVPGNWEVQGYGTAIYVNQPYEFSPVRPVPAWLPEENPVGVYRRTVTIPQEWDGRRVFLNVCGAKSGVFVYVNGHEAGYHEDSKDLARYDVTPFIDKGENTIVLKIYRWSSGSYLECQDFWRISGIERDVYLSTEKEDSGFDFAVVSSLDDSLDNGVFRLTVNGKEPFDFGYELIDPAKGRVLDGGGRVDGEAVFEGTVPDVRKWSAEDPQLYTLLMKVNGEYARFNVGFRKLGISDWKIGERTVRTFLVNGQPVKFKGVNVHEHSDVTGHYITRDDILRDLKLMKEANINAIRTCHYPQPRIFYELCDSLGFYVYDEANIESHGMGYNLNVTLGNNPAWLGKHLDRVQNMYMRTRNYPSVVILSLGNEAGNGYNFYEAYLWVKKMEKDGQDRPVCYERAEYEWNTDMIVPQYPGADWFRRMGETYNARPVCPSEYAHAMGNSTGSLDLQWKYIYDYPHLQGGFIWDWIDQGLRETDADGRTYWTYGGDYGENSPSDANFLCNGLIGPDREPHPGLAEVKHVYQNIKVSPVNAAEGVFRIFNRHYFIDLSAFDLLWTLERNGVAVKSGRLHFDTPAQSGEDFTVKLPRLDNGGEYRINFDAVTRYAQPLIAKGYAVATDQILLKEGEGAIFTADKAYKVSLSEDGDCISLSGKNFTAVFDRNEGILKKYVFRGKEIFDSGFGFRPNFWRGPTDNDYGNMAPVRLQEWKTASASCKAIVSADGDEAAVTAVYELPYGCTMTVKYAFPADGVMTVDGEFRKGTGNAVEIPRIGFRMRLPASADSFSYFGRGPEENYWDRNSGARKSLYSSSALAEYVPYVRPQECGHHTGVSRLNLEGVTVFAGAEPFEFNVLRNRVEDFDSEENTDRDYQWHNFTPDEKHDAGEARNAMRRQTHVNDIVPRDEVEVCIDYKMTGVGGYDSWGSRPEPSRTLTTDNDYDFGFTFIFDKAKIKIK